MSSRATRPSDNEHQDHLQVERNQHLPAVVGNIPPANETENLTEPHGFILVEGPVGNGISQPLSNLIINDSFVVEVPVAEFGRGHPVPSPEEVPINTEGWSDERRQWWQDAVDRNNKT